MNKVIDQGAYLSYHCAEETRFTDRARLAAADERRPWMRHVAYALSIVDTCRMWRVKSGGSVEALPVKSDLPVLILAGEYDPVTPPASARSAAAHLRNSHLFVFPGMGHWVTETPVSTCPQTLVLEFLDHPNRRPRSECLEEWKPRWETSRP